MESLLKTITVLVFNSAVPALQFSIGIRLVLNVFLDLSTAHSLHYIILLALVLCEMSAKTIISRYVNSAFLHYTILLVLVLYGMSAKTIMSRYDNSAFPSLHYSIGTCLVWNVCTDNNV